MKVARGVGNIELTEIDEPMPGTGQVKIRIGAAGICGTDIHIYKDEFRSHPPVVLGHEIAGEIVDVGAGVEQALLGKRVTSETYFSTCGACMYCRRGQSNLCLKRLSIGSGVNGGFTKYLIVPVTNIHELPSHIDYHSGALTEPLACVVHGVLNHATVRPGDTAVIAGPGAIGLMALQVVKSAGATVVMLGTNVDESRLKLAHELGADYIINVQQQQPHDVIAEITQEGLGADVVYECSGANPAAQQLLELVRRRGHYVQIGLFGQRINWDLDQVCYKELVVTGSNASVPSAWDKALKLLDTGIVQTAPLITHTYDVTQWQQAFDTFDAKTGIKTLLTPVD
ncbi:MAG: zinc-binding dehydrogenase [Aggregatilineales bacterium]